MAGRRRPGAGRARRRILCGRWNARWIPRSDPIVKWRGGTWARGIRMKSSQVFEEDIAERIRELGPWFHNLQIHGIQTAPDHFLGDYPSVKWQRFEPGLPRDLAG